MSRRGKDSLSSHMQHRKARDAAPWKEGKSAPPAPLLVPKLAISAHEPSPRSVAWLDDRTVAFPVGKHLWRADVHSLAVSYLARRQHATSPHLTVSKRKLLLAESVPGGCAQLTLLELGDASASRLAPNSTVTSVWRFAHPFSGNVRAVCMSADGKLLAALVVQSEGEAQGQAQAAGAAAKEKEAKSRSGSGSVSSLALWRVDSQKLVATRELDQGLVHLSVNPEDRLTLCATGDGYARVLKVLSGSQLDETPLLKRPKERGLAFRQHAWLSNQTLAAVVEEDEGQHSSIAILQRGDVIQSISRSAGRDSIGAITDIVALQDREIGRAHV